jgi:hypothetical protein
MTQPFLSPYPELLSLFEGADIHDVKSAESMNALPVFLARFFSYAPFWLRMGVYVRQAVAKLTGIDLPPLVMEKQFAPGEIPFEEGAAFEFFTVLKTKEHAYWTAEAGDSHIKAVMIILREPAAEDGPALFYVTTIVKYLSLQGKIYYFLIRPAHHIGLRALTKAGAR